MPSTSSDSTSEVRTQLKQSGEQSGALAGHAITGVDVTGDATRKATVYLVPVEPGSFQTVVPLKVAFLGTAPRPGSRVAGIGLDAEEFVKRDPPRMHADRLRTGP